MGTRAVPQRSPDGKESVVVVVDRIWVVAELAVGLETFVEHCLAAALELGAEHAPGYAERVGKALMSRGWTRDLRRAEQALGSNTPCPRNCTRNKR